MENQLQCTSSRAWIKIVVGREGKKKALLPFEPMPPRSRGMRSTAVLQRCPLTLKLMATFLKIGGGSKKNCLISCRNETAKTPLQHSSFQLGKSRRKSQQSLMFYFIHFSSLWAPQLLPSTRISTWRTFWPPTWLRRFPGNKWVYVSHVRSWSSSIFRKNCLFGGRRKCWRGSKWD